MIKVLNTKAGMIGAGVLVAGLVVYFFGRKTIAGAVDAVSNVNAGTPYEGGGLLGTLGNITNRASGGFLERFGSWLGGSIYDVVHKHTLDPNQRATSSTAPATRAEDRPGSLRY